ncbi:MAG: hypothetical protein HOP03_02395 [Lysobacter sp.]|nr:hypothetical protein [Lysobacter sp.]
MTSDHPRQDSHTALDEAARRAHAASLDRLSPRVQAQLAQRHRAAMKQASGPAPVRVWPMLALGSAAALTLAVGLFVVRDNRDGGAPKPAGTIAAASDIEAASGTNVPAADTGTSSAPVIASADAPDVAVDAVAVDDTLIDSASTDGMPIENDALPEELLAAEFDTADETMGFDALQESPDFYLWLGSEESQADVTESL